MKVDESYGYTADVFGNIIQQNQQVFEYRPRPVKFDTPNMQRKAAMMSSARQDWTTPLWFYQELCKARAIDYYDTDPATNKDNPLGCNTFYTEEKDGLMHDWPGNVFINPPFGWGYYKDQWTYITGLWIKEAWYRCFSDMYRKSNTKMITMIIPAAVSTKVYHKYIWSYENARARPGVRVNFYPKRIKFGGSKMVAPFSTMILDFIKPLSK